MLKFILGLAAGWLIVQKLSAANAQAQSAAANIQAAASSTQVMAANILKDVSNWGG